MFNTVKMFTFVVPLAGSRYGGHIPATSFEQVKELVPNAEDIGELIEERPAGQICSICAGDMIVETQTPTPVEDWGDIIE